MAACLGSSQITSQEALGAERSDRPASPLGSLPRYQRRQAGGEDAAFNRVQKWLQAGRRPFARGDLVKVATSNGHVAPTRPKWAEYRPAYPIEHDFRADIAVQEGHADTFTLALRRVAIFAEAVSEEAAEQRLG